MSEPKPNEVYRRKGFRFVVHDVRNGMVYVARDGERLRVTLATWQQEMKGAKPLNVPKRNSPARGARMRKHL